MTRALLALMMVFTAGCASTPPETKSRLDTLSYRASNGRARTLVVLLPGMGDNLATFERKGFVTAARERNAPIDVLAVDAHYGYYAAASMWTRLREDVVAPARAAGYEQIWLLGISMGGYGALAYARDYPREVDGVIALAPFIAMPEFVTEIERAGGLARWPAPASAPTPITPLPPSMPRQERIALWGEDQRALLAWLRDNASSAAGTPIYLGYGDYDRLARSNALLAAMLPPQQVAVTVGGHDWITWRTLWKQFLERRFYDSTARWAEQKYRCPTPFC